MSPSFLITSKTEAGAKAKAVPKPKPGADAWKESLHEGENADGPKVKRVCKQRAKQAEMKEAHKGRKGTKYPLASLVAV